MLCAHPGGRGGNGSWCSGMSGRMTHRAIVVGNRESVEHLAAVLGRQRGFGYRLVGACLTGRTRSASVLACRWWGQSRHLKAAALDANADAVIITSSDATHPDMVRRLGWELEGHEVEIIVAPSLANIAGPRVHIRPVAGLPLLHVEKPAYRGGARWAKGALDRLGAAALLLLWLSAVGGGGRRCEDDEPWGHLLRAGAGRARRSRHLAWSSSARWWRAPTRCSTTSQPDSGNAMMFKMRDDPRVTRVGQAAAPILAR